MILEKHHAPVRVLIIDDDFFVRDALEMFVRNLGCLCVGSPSAEDGLKVLDAQFYDIVVCDYRLPGLDGICFFSRIQGKTPGPLKILISAYATPDLITEAQAVGIDGFHQKPFTGEKIESTLTRMVETVRRKCFP